MRAVILACALAASIAGGAARAGEPDKTAEVMAAYIYNFARFVEWPATALPASPAPIVLCTPDANALDGNLVRIHGREAQGHRIVVRVLSVPDTLDGCHMLFLPAVEASRAPAYLAGRERQPILTISDAPDFAGHGGVISLMVEAGRVHFAIDRAVATNAGLRVSSRLLALARNGAGPVTASGATP